MGSFEIALFPGKSHCEVVTIVKEQDLIRCAVIMLITTLALDNIVSIMSAYSVAFDLTVQTIERRARFYRNLIAVIIAVSLCSAGGALAAWTPEAMTGLLLIYPVCCFYFFLDERLLNDWRSQLCANWAKKELDFWAFRDAMLAMPNFPKATLQSMVETLPASPDWSMERAASERTRKVLTLVVTAIHDSRANTALIKAAAAAMVAVSIIFTMVLGVWYPILFIAAIALLPLFGIGMKGRRLRKLRTSIIAARQDAEFNGELFTGLINYLNWGGISLSEKTEVSAAISFPVPAISNI